MMHFCLLSQEIAWTNTLTVVYRYKRGSEPVLRPNYEGL
jgi:hypothetical protein